METLHLFFNNIGFEYNCENGVGELTRRTFVILMQF